VENEKKALILGGGGFVGSHLAERLLRKGFRVSIFDRPNLRRPSNLVKFPQLRWYEGDFVNHESLAEAIEEDQIVFHLVSTTLPKSSNENPVFDVESNLVGTLRLLDLMRDKGAQKIVFVSSGGTVYGVPKQVPIPESAPTEPLCSYGIAKLAIEKYLHLYGVLHGLKHVAIRLANPYGERQRPALAQGAVAVFLDRVMNGRAIEIWGDGSVVRDYIYAGDAADAIISASLYDGVGSVFNVGSGRGYSLNQIIEAIFEITNRKVEVLYSSGRPFDVPVSVLDISMARSELDWEPKTKLSEGVDLAWRWMLESRA